MSITSPPPVKLPMQPAVPFIATMATLNPNAARDADRWLFASPDNLPPIIGERDYEAVLFAVDQVIDARADTPELVRLIALTDLITRYEKAHYPI